ncbi:hypothetical protein G6F68_018429 [Rhizopus microsporus]|nr:hypothetical protein G6F68_018429 [Rhizopus microsporus]
MTSPAIAQCPHHSAPVAVKHGLIVETRGEIALIKEVGRTNRSAQALEILTQLTQVISDHRINQGVPADLDRIGRVVGRPNIPDAAAQAQPGERPGAYGVVDEQARHVTRHRRWA